MSRVPPAVRHQKLRPLRFSRRQRFIWHWYDLRRWVARRWKTVASAIYEWIWP